MGFVIVSNQEFLEVNWCLIVFLVCSDGSELSFGSCEFLLELVVLGSGSNLADSSNHVTDTVGEISGLRLESSDDTSDSSGKSLNNENRINIRSIGSSLLVSLFSLQVLSLLLLSLEFLLSSSLLLLELLLSSSLLRNEVHKIDLIIRVIV